MLNVERSNGEVGQDVGVFEPDVDARVSSVSVVPVLLTLLLQREHLITELAAQSHRRRYSDVTHSRMLEQAACHHNARDTLLPDHPPKIADCLSFRTWMKITLANEAGRLRGDIIP